MSPNSAIMRDRRIVRRRAVGQLSDVDRARDVRIAMPEEKCDLVNALAGQQRRCPAAAMITGAQPDTRALSWSAM
jgi:hypothetical protein